MSYSVVEQTTAKPAGGMVQIGENISQATRRIDSLADSLGALCENIHGPRPSAVPPEARDAAPRSDSLSYRVEMLMEAIRRLETKYEQIVR
jgi:hypothetical protein